VLVGVRLRLTSATGIRSFRHAPIIVELIWVSVSARIQFGGNIIAYPDAGVRLAISRAIAEETPRGPQITKEKRQKGPLRSLRLTRPIADRLSGHAVARLSPDFAFIGFGSAKAPRFLTKLEHRHSFPCAEAFLRPSNHQRHNS
jgi:hypothetical protein